MTILLTKLPSIEAEQFNLPGLHGFFGSGGWVMNPYPAEPVEEPGTPAPGLDQLHFGANQEPLTEPPAQACQLPLLPDPPVWEAPSGPPPRSRKGRPAGKRPNQGLSPGQMSLF